MLKIAEAYTNLDTVKIRYILHVLDLVEPLLCESNVENAEACTNLDTAKITYILHVLDLVEPLKPNKLPTVTCGIQNKMANVA
jgi:predicted transcriptional regulator